MNIQSQDIIKVGLSCAIHKKEFPLIDKILYLLLGNILVKKRNDNILIYTILDVR
jgi:hypothetical protein